MSLFQWEHQLFCYDWLFYKCFSVPFCRNVLTRSGYWLLITQLNCLYCTTDFLGINLTRLFWHQSGISVPFLCERKETKQCELFLRDIGLSVTDSFQLQSLNTLFVITVNITSYESLIVYYCKYIWSLCKSSPYKKKKKSTFCRASSSRTDCTWALLLLSVSEAPVKSEINKC